MTYKVSLLPGDGIGPEVALAAQRCVDATGVRIIWEECPAGDKAMEKYGTPLPEETLESIRKNKVALKGPITTPVGKGFRSVNVQLRKSLDLYACVRPCKSYEGVRSRFENIDLVIVRENTEDLYAGIEFESGSEEADFIIDYARKATDKNIFDKSAISIKPISPFGSERVIRYAFEYAIRWGRKKVTAVHKANIMKATDGLFLHTFEEVAKEYAGKVQADDRIVDNMCMQLVQRPEEYDVLVLPNLYGDIVSDLAAGLIGGLGVAPGGNIGQNGALFEPTHGSAPKYAGQNKVNPTATILSAVQMLSHLGEQDAAQTLEKAIATVIARGDKVTYDFKLRRDDPSAVGTQEMADAIIEEINVLATAKAQNR
ncbi:MAG: isocitrate/isopropylmalate dehydrogenase family protein [Candidatus Omnitrophica bacterium]|nr:isocitrate/isopropylmalate dehydrogenase family protein [Candidatus Omnitrophota bacterium]